MEYNPPKDIKELQEVYYGDSRGSGFSPEGINRYEKYLGNPNNWQSGLNIPEQDVKEFLERIGEVVKIQEDNKQKLPDFKIKDKNLFVEVKSINTVIENRIGANIAEINIESENGFIDKVNLTLDGICSKQVEKNNFYVGTIWLDVVQYSLTKIKLDKSFIDKTNFQNKKLDGLLLFFQPVVGNVEAKKHILFSKKGNVVELFKIYPESALEIIKC